MKRAMIAVIFLCGVANRLEAQQATDVKFIADTLVVQAEGTYEADPDLATLVFDISSQDKELKRAYETATQSMERIVALADKTGLKKQDISTGVLTLAPSYERDRKNKAKSYSVHGQMTLRIRDFSQIGALLDESVQEGIVDFRSLTYSLQDEEMAKQKAVAEAMRRAVGRASAALGENGQKPGAVRYASLDVEQVLGVARLENYATTETVEVQSIPFGGARAKAPPPPPPFPAARPQKITINATVQCAFQIK